MRVVKGQALFVFCFSRALECFFFSPPPQAHPSCFPSLAHAMQLPPPAIPPTPTVQDRAVQAPGDDGPELRRCVSLLLLFVCGRRCDGDLRTSFFLGSWPAAPGGCCCQARCALGVTGRVQPGVGSPGGHGGRTRRCPRTKSPRRTTHLFSLSRHPAAAALNHHTTHTQQRKPGASWRRPSTRSTTTTRPACRLRSCTGESWALWLPRRREGGGGRRPLPARVPAPLSPLHVDPPPGGVRWAPRCLPPCFPFSHDPTTPTTHNTT